MRTKPRDLDDIVAALADRIDSLVAKLLPKATKEGHEYRIGSVAGEEGRSMWICRSGAKQGEWYDFGASIGGDPLHLVAHVLFHGRVLPDALRWARAWLGIDALDPDSLRTYRQHAADRNRAVAEEDERNRAAAFRIYMEGRPILGTPAAAYLAGRGINVASLTRDMQSLRFHPALWNVESQRKWPALIGAITLESRVVAVHRTWLQVKPGAGVVKAPLKENKMTLGRYAGGAIRLWRGDGARPLRRCQPGEWIMLSEGIEDGLTGVQNAPEYRTWAAVSLANMGNIQLPENIAGVLILAQNDKEPDAIRALDRAIVNFQRQGKRVRLAEPPADVKDVNDVQRRLMGGAPEDAAG